MQELKDSFELITFPKIKDTRGNLSVVEQYKHVPFDIKRVYYTYDIPADSSRGGHAHKNLHQVLIAISGSFDVTLDDGKTQTKVFLNKPNIGLHIKPGIWREINNFSAGSVVFVLASDVYNEDDYIRNYDNFKKYRL
ncbi:MAG: FdtA/QdtA family cupin domain-containing protein [Carboxylicivirga sp.]|jgi:dTDP-4-dehydrorhamnose 3,5-epimerase-like enzyme|nr:FdtA/QdtA family cupin domain-containing protein [Carboxylicivirga sp.]MCT4644429.1 FdtA/QdtA family cupin domain-containing protein [Carboxylicivirga sp.]